MIFIDNKFRAPRHWSNECLRKISPHITGRVLNASGWRDEDKQGDKYKNYFIHCSDYVISNYEDSEQGGLQGDIGNEIFLDLTQELPIEMHGAFDCVFSHTVLEHVFEVQTAFRNLSKLSSDLVVTVVPFLQEEHTDYGDYWRFTPQALRKLLNKNGFEMIYLNYNDVARQSIYVIAVGAKFPTRWSGISQIEDNKVTKYDHKIGTRVIKNSVLSQFIKKLVNKLWI